MFRVRLKSLREDAKMSQADLARELGVAQSTVGMWESGRNSPNIEMLIKMADLFGCTTDYLLGRVGYPQSEIKKAPPESGAEEYAKDKDVPEFTIDEIKRLKAFLESQQ